MKIKIERENDRERSGGEKARNLRPKIASDMTRMEKK